MNKPFETLYELYDHFDQNYQYKKRMMEMVNDPQYKAQLAELDQRARAEGMSFDQYGLAVTELQKSFMPDFPWDEFKQALEEYGKSKKPFWKFW